MAIPRYNATIKNLNYRLRSFKDNLPEYLRLAILDYKTSEAIIKAITEEQLYRQGITGKGVEIMSYAPYKDSTIRYKIKKGQPTNRVTLFDTGSFYGNMYVIADAEGFYIISKDPKTEKIIAKYGNDIFRLTDSNFTNIVRNYIRPEIIRRLKEVINDR